MQTESSGVALKAPGVQPSNNLVFSAGTPIQSLKLSRALGF